jgi:hypothetical protein
MADRVRTCPRCGAPLSPGPFARTTTCAFCHSIVQLDEQVVSAAKFRDAFRRWSTPDEARARAWILVGEEAWSPIRLLGRGEIADVYLVERARQPSELALLKVLRDAADLPMLEQEWSALQALQSSTARGADAIAPRLPQPIARGEVSGGDHSGSHAELLRHARGFAHTLEAVRAAFPRGVDPHAGVWMWRRLLEILAFVHEAGFVHGAVLPQHLLVERGEHGLRLVGFGCAARVGEPLAAVVSRYEAFYPERMLSKARLSPEHDVAMSARSIAYALRPDDGARLPDSVPEALRESVLRAGAGEFSGGAWELRELVGVVGQKSFGAPSFHPIRMPDEPARMS